MKQMARDDSLERAAQEFASSRSLEARERLCQAALPLVRRLAAQVVRRLPPHFTTDDLIGDGCVGLVRAINRFDPSRGLRFDVWAARLIRGAMLNGLRRMDFIPERVRRDARHLDRARWNLAQHAGTSPDDRLAATSAGLSERKLRIVLLALRRAIPLSLDATLSTAADHPPTLGECLAAPAADPAQLAARRAVTACLIEALAALPPRERTVIASFYGREVSLRAIGGALGISKQRVSQLHARALRALRDYMTGRHLEA